MRSFTWRNAFIFIGIAALAPYFLRRLMPLLDGRVGNIRASDVGMAGRDSVRDAADDLDVGGVSGKVDRTIDRVADRIQH